MFEKIKFGDEWKMGSKNYTEQKRAVKQGIKARKW